MKSSPLLALFFLFSTVAFAREIKPKSYSSKINAQGGIKLELHNPDPYSNPSLSTIFDHDNLRVHSLTARILKKQYTVSAASLDRSRNSDISTPLSPGASFGVGNYITTIKLGTPSKSYAMVVDTGSSLTWLQCSPCKVSCHDQVGPIFDPSTSKSYSAVSCSATECSSLTAATLNPSGCSHDVCLYEASYGDSSFSVGYLSKETLKLGALSIPNFVYGCGQDNEISDQMLSDCSSFDLSQFDLSHDMFNLGSFGHGNNNLCTAAPWHHPKEEQLHEAEWNDIAESELEETLLRNLNMMFKSAIIKIMSHGYNEETAIVSILKTGLCFGVKDFVTSIVDNALLFLKSGCEFDYVIGDKLFEELNRREMSALNEMIGVVKDFRPSISRGEAMWRLLVSDMNVIYACSIGSAFSSAPSVGLEPKSCNSDTQANPVSNSLGPYKPNFALPNTKNTIDKDAPNVFGVTSLPNGTFSASIKESSSSLNCLIEETSSLFISQPKSSSGKRVHFGKREPILRRKTIHFEKGYRKSIIRASRNSSTNGVVFDRKTKSFPDFNNTLTMKDTLMKLNKAVGGDILPPKADVSLNSSLKDVPIKLNDIANTELSLSLPSSGNDGICVSPDKLDEMLQKMSIREKVLEAERQDWTEWAQQKVMEAAHRLGKDKLELQSLRLEKDEVSRLKKEKQALENSTRKKLAELEISLSEACAEIEKNNTEARNMERENIELNKALVAVKFEAAESAANYRKFSKKDLNDDKNVKFREREKALLREELVNLKKKSSHLKQQLEQAKVHYDQLEARWKKQEMMKQEHLDQHNALKKEEDQIKISSKSKENEMRLKAETELQRHKDDIRKLELQILKLRQKTDSSKIAALHKWSSDPKTAGDREVIYKLLELQDDEDEDDVDREKECVMCLSEEMSVMFLPCTHQVLCEACNEMHQKQGMKDCPSCRTKIEKRVIVSSA